MVIVEFLSNGDLQDYLRKSRVAQADSAGAQETKTYTNLQPRTLLSFGRQVALGMDHISKNNVGHFLFSFFFKFAPLVSLVATVGNRVLVLLHLAWLYVTLLHLTLLLLTPLVLTLLYFTLLYSPCCT